MGALGALSLGTLGLFGLSLHPMLRRTLGHHSHGALETLPSVGVKFDRRSRFAALAHWDQHMSARPRKQRRHPNHKKSYDIYGTVLNLTKQEPEFTIRELSDGEIYAVGMITVHWAFLEHALFLDTARRVNRAKLRSMPPDADSLSFDRRLAAWRTIVDATITRPKDRKRLFDLHQRIARTKTMRHRVTHGLWKWFPSNPDRLMAHSFRPGVSFVDYNVTIKKLIATFQEISALNYLLSVPPRGSKGVDKWGGAMMRKWKAHNFAYLSRRSLLEITGREHAELVPRRPKPPAQKLPRSSSPKSSA
jgi:hypothetical protein